MNVVLKLPRPIFQNHSVLDSGSGYMGCLAVLGPDHICRVTADLHGCWAFPFSGHQQVHFLGEGTSDQTSVEAGTLHCLWDGTLSSGQSVLGCDNEAKILSF